MKGYVTICCILMIVACKKQQSNEVTTIESNIGTMRASIDLTINGEVYLYDNINWKKSSIKKEEDLNIRLIQQGLPKVEFRFPDVESSLSNELNSFKIPDMKRGLKQLQLSFFDESKEVRNKLNKHIVFRKGEIRASFKDNLLTIGFKGEGGPMADRKTTFPINGSICININ